MPRCYMVKKGLQRHEGPSPRSPTAATTAPPCHSPEEHSSNTEVRVAQYAELGAGVCERSAADTEAAHGLLSLAQGVPPLPPAAVLTVLEPAPVLPIYTYTIQPTNIYILTEDQPDLYHTVTEVPVHYAPDLELCTALHTEIVAQPHTQPSSPYYTAEAVTELPPPEQQEHSPPPLSPPLEEQPKSIPTPVIRHSNKEKARYNCSECGKRYATSSNLSRHKQTHRSLDSVAAKRCHECGRACVSMPALAMHVLTHRMAHVCAECGKQFSRPWLLRGHQRSHTGEKPYSCSSCGKAFADRSNLRAHIATHTQDKKYECPRCKKNFALKSYLNKHQESSCTRDEDDDDEVDDEE